MADKKPGDKKPGFWENLVNKGKERLGVTAPPPAPEAPRPVLKMKKAEKPTDSTATAPAKVADNFEFPHYLPASKIFFTNPTTFGEMLHNAKIIEDADSAQAGQPTEPSKKFFTNPTTFGEMLHNAKIIEDADSAQAGQPTEPSAPKTPETSKPTRPERPRTRGGRDRREDRRNNRPAERAAASVAEPRKFSEMTAAEKEAALKEEDPTEASPQAFSQATTSGNTAPARPNRRELRDQARRQRIADKRKATAESGNKSDEIWDSLKKSVPDDAYQEFRKALDGKKANSLALMDYEDIFKPFVIQHPEVCAYNSYYEFITATKKGTNKAPKATPATAETESSEKKPKIDWEGLEASVDTPADYQELVKILNGESDNVSVARRYGRTIRNFLIANPTASKFRSAKEAIGAAEQKAGVTTEKPTAAATEGQPSPAAAEPDKKDKLNLNALFAEPKTADQLAALDKKSHHPTIRKRKHKAEDFGLPSVENFDLPAQHERLLGFAYKAYAEAGGDALKFRTILLTSLLNESRPCLRREDFEDDKYLAPIADDLSALVEALPGTAETVYLGPQLREAMSKGKNELSANDIKFMENSWVPFFAAAPGSRDYKAFKDAIARGKKEGVNPEILNFMRVALKRDADFKEEEPPQPKPPARPAAKQTVAAAREAAVAAAQPTEKAAEPVAPEPAAVKVSAKEEPRVPEGREVFLMGEPVPIIPAAPVLETAPNNTPRVPEGREVFLMGEPAPQIIKAADLPPSEPTPEPEATTAEPLADAGSNEPAPLTMPEEEPEPAWLQDALKIEEDFHQSLRPNAETDFEDVTDEERDALFNKILELGVLHFQQKLEAGKRADEAYLEISDELKTVPAPESGWASEDLIVTNKEAIEKLLKEHPILKDSGLTFDIIRYWAYSANHPDMTPEGQEKLASPLADMSEQQIAGAVFNALPDGTGENAGHNMFEDDALEERAALTQQTPTQPESEAGEKLVNPDTLEPTTGGAKVEPETPFDLNVDVEEAPANTTSNGLITPSATNRTPEISGLIELPDEDMVEEPAEELLQTPAPAAEAAPKPTTTLPEDSTLIDLPALARAAVQDLGTRPTERAMPIVTEAPEVMVDVPGLETRRFADREFKNWVVATSGASVGQIDHLHPDRKNQDMFDAIPELGVYFVGDGMGGYAGGDIASQKTRELIHTYAPNFLAGTQTLEKKKQSIEELVSVVNSKLYEIKKSGDPTYARMGSTLTMLVLHENPDGTLYAINMNVGDSPAYVNYQNESDLFPVTSEDNPTTKGVLKKLKPDAAGRLIYALQNATSEEEFETLLPNDTERTGARDAFYNRNQIEQYIGMSRDPQPHILTLMIKDPVKFLLTSDGVSDQTTAIKLGELAKAARSPSELSQTAVEAGYDTAYRNQNMRTKVHRAYDGQDDYGDDTTALAVFVTPKQK